MKLTTNHPSSSYGQPVLVGKDGPAYGPADFLPDGSGAATYVLEHPRCGSAELRQRFLRVGVDAARR